jgi:hypothetical protein
VEIALSFLAGNARIRAPIWLKIHMRVTMDWGICGSASRPIWGRKIPSATGVSGAQARYKNVASPRIANERVMTARVKKRGAEERRAAG